MISYAQNFEDVMLARVFAGKSDGFYVDVGAADPINLSVTKWFYDLGWDGINIEPNRPLFQRLLADRPRDINLDCGIGACASDALFFEPEIGELSTFDADVQQNAEGSGLRGTTRSVRVLPLTDVLAQHGKGRTIDFLKIDVEGWEFEVLKGLDLARYRPVVILLEATLPRTQEPSHMAWEPTLLGADYSFVYFDGVNRFYLANERGDLKENFSRPPNAFDEFETFPLVRAQQAADERLKSLVKLEQELVRSDSDRAERLIAIETLESRLRESEDDRAARLAGIDKLERSLQAAERDRAARLAAIGKLEDMLREAEQDRAARLASIGKLEDMLREAEQDRAARLASIGKLEDMLREAEQDRAARLASISKLEDMLREAEQDRAARLAAIGKLEDMLREAEQDRAARLNVVQDLERQLRDKTTSLQDIHDSRIWRLMHPKWLDRFSAQRKRQSAHHGADEGNNRDR